MIEQLDGGVLLANIITAAVGALAALGLRDLIHHRGRRWRQ